MTRSDRNKLKRVATPFLELDEDLEDTDEGGELSTIALKVLMKILYAARMVRYDLLRPVTYLASRITKWSKVCDRKLLRLVSYINCSKDHVLRGWIGDKLDDLKLGVWSDADFAGCKITMRSTSGCYVALTGHNSFFPLSAFSRKQTCVSHSTPEAELVAADASLRQEGLPAQIFWETLKEGNQMKLEFYEDNQAAIQVIKSGKNPNMKHMGRTHKVCTMWLHENVQNDPDVKMIYADSLEMCADIFTKDLSDKAKWEQAIRLINIGPMGDKIQARKVSDACIKRKEERKAKEDAGEIGSHLNLSANKNISKQKGAQRGG